MEFISFIIQLCLSILAYLMGKGAGRKIENEKSAKIVNTMLLTAMLRLLEENSESRLTLAEIKDKIQSVLGYHLINAPKTEIGRLLQIMLESKVVTETSEGFEITMYGSEQLKKFCLGA